MPFPEKWNMNPVAQMPEPITELKQWFEGLVLQRPYFEHAWMELSKGVGKDVAIRPPSGDKEVPAPKQAKEKKRKEAPSSPVSKKKKPARKSRKRKEGSSIMPSDLIRRLRDEPEEGEEEVASLVLNHEAFLQIREEHEAEVQNLTEKSDSYKLLSEKLQVDLVMARDEHSEMAEQAKAKGMVEHVKWYSRREALKGAQAQSFDIMFEIKKARAEEARARKLAFPEEDSESLSESEDGEDPEDGSATSDVNQAS
ncbi:protein gar2-like [Nicotiana tomentosiformis]|uniref:protein gar2-like n=1 Tax=Nicotiana tomentosiformis TaxID=4098 RepID=UPI00388C54AD